MTNNIYLDSDTSEEVASEFNKLVSDRRKELNLSVRELGTFIIKDKTKGWLFFIIRTIDGKTETEYKP